MTTLPDQHYNCSMAGPCSTKLLRENTVISVCIGIAVMPVCSMITCGMAQSYVPPRAARAFVHSFLCKYRKNQTVIVDIVSKLLSWIERHERHWEYQWWMNGHGYNKVSSSIRLRFIYFSSQMDVSTMHVNRKSLSLLYPWWDAMMGYRSYVTMF